ncbi:NADP-dependent oxidoreductase [Longitalea arenae]|uniref:NADP-dependent oxidoreductase n=1 Tax=Longitalea arenae TaxID=2812558 RepID=UPI0019688B5B|nr:NADP-dependent oxidoreductase [Longitalea arenae]
MKAIILNEFGGTDQLIHTELPVPSIKDDEVLVKVVAISINPVDVKTRTGKGISGRIKERPLILGWDISGIVTATGKAVSSFKTGDEVFGMVNFPGHGKAYAEYLAAPAAQLALKPATITHQQAAATTLAALTAWQVLFQQASLQQGQRVLIHAAAGGVGHFAVQLARQAGAYVIGTASAANKDFLMELGANEHIDYKSQRFEEVVSYVDLVLDAVGGELIPRSLAVLKPNGKLISIPTTIAPDLVQQAAARNIDAFFYLVQSNGKDMERLAALLNEGALRPYVNHYDFSQMDMAHQQQATGSTRGKIVLTIA